MKGLKAILAWLLLCIIWACNTDDDGSQTDNQGVNNAATIYYQIDENPLDGTIIGTVPGIEGNSNLRFSLFNSDPIGALGIDENTGELYVRDSTFFNFEVNPVIWGTTKVTDNSSTIQRGINIRVSDVYEEFSFHGSVQLNNQPAVNEFAEGRHFAISGALTIAPTPGTSLDLSSLSTLERVGSLYIIGFSGSTTGLHNIRQIDRNLGLREMNGWNDEERIDLNIEFIGRDISIIENEQVTSLEDLGIALAQLGGSLEIRDNNSLVSLEGLEIGHITEDLTLWGNSSLESLIGINLREVDGAMKIQRNTALASLDGLQLERVGGLIQLNQNFALTDISALSTLEEAGDNISVTANYLLSDLCGLSNCIVNGGLSGVFQTSQNYYNPTLQQMLDGECSY